MWWKVSLSLVVLISVLSACASSPSTPVPTLSSSDPVEIVATPTVESAEPVLLPSESPPVGAEAEYATDFSRHTVPYSEILSSQPPLDEVQALDEPNFINVDAADDWIADVEPVVFVKVGEDARAYPVQILMWHGIVNDVVGELPVAVTYSPLSNTVIVFERRLDEATLDFGLTGRERFSNLILYDRQTETWWQQATGTGIAGEYAGRQLDVIPASVIAWSDFKAAYPEGQVLSRNTGVMQRYGQAAYTSYDNVDAAPRFYAGPETPDALTPMMRVLTLGSMKDAVTYPYAALQADKVVNDTVDGEPVVVFWQSGVTSPVHTPIISEGRDVGTAVAFSRVLDGETLVFKFEEGRIVDEATGSVWNILGQATEGPMAGQQLDPVVSVNHFWFSWAAFNPEARIYQQQTTVAEDPAVETPVADLSAVIAETLPFDFAVMAYQGEDVLGGEALYFSDVLAQGKPAIVNLGAGLCPACRTEFPELQDAYELYGDDVIFLIVDVGSFTGLGDRVDTLNLLEELNVSVPAASTPDPALLHNYSVTGIPSTLYFTPDGEVFHRSAGLMGGEAFYKQIEDLIAASQ